MSVSLQVFEYLCLCVCLCICMYVCFFVGVCVSISLCVCFCVSVCMCMDVIYQSVCVCVYIPLSTEEFLHKHEQEVNGMYENKEVIINLLVAIPVKKMTLPSSRH